MRKNAAEIMQKNGQQNFCSFFYLGGTKVVDIQFMYSVYSLICPLGYTELFKAS